MECETCAKLIERLEGMMEFYLHEKPDGKPLPMFVRKTQELLNTIQKD